MVWLNSSLLLSMNECWPSHYLWSWRVINWNSKPRFVPSLQIAVCANCACRISNCSVGLILGAEQQLKSSRKSLLLLLHSALGAAASEYILCLAPRLTSISKGRWSKGRWRQRASSEFNFDRKPKWGRAGLADKDACCMRCLFSQSGRASDWP